MKRSILKTISCLVLLKIFLVLVFTTQEEVNRIFFASIGVIIGLIAYQHMIIKNQVKNEKNRDNKFNRW